MSLPMIPGEADGGNSEVESEEPAEVVVIAGQLQEAMLLKSEDALEII